MMNRIAFLAQEELRLDRDIEAARRKAAEALARQATRDQEIAATAKEVLAVMPTASAAKLRPHTGRSALLASLSEGSGGAAAAAAASLRSSVAAQSSSKSLGDAAAGGAAAGAGAGAAGAGAGAAERRSSGAAAGSSGRASLEGPGGTAGTSGPGIPPRAPSASRGRPPVPVGRAADRLNKLPPVAPPGSGSTSLRSASPGAGAAGASGRPLSGARPGTASLRRGTASSPASAAASPPTSAPGGPVLRRPSSSGSASGSRGAAAAAAAAAAPGPVVSAASRGSAGEADPDLALAAGGGGARSGGGLQQLPGSHGHGHGHGQDWEGGELAAGGAWAAAGGRNAMAVIHGGVGGEGAHGAELDAEVIEELAHGHGHGGAGGAGPSGLQEFATDGGGTRRVVQVKGASRKGDGSVVSAAGVGWGMGGRPGAAGATTIAPKEAKALKAELAKKQSIWKVRKTFGLDPTPMSDRTAQVEELGAGAWQ
ncbi:hypothetical protein HYH02_009355 [Chlamydomonas schloesseri]|uniref:Uncharacterized protein n=1 Tax=Chlamydomonas schloesseri TaxID=2026947 RepID=A0A835TRW5_9CHLO|nr:hypothetical protein HYH02_009355 [Chlamydomonas schloesseri]|eukprot:KAG2443285.1 hypothetical protein HYH02_009355 [Chlamydomonas schloesseri]